MIARVTHDLQQVIDDWGQQKPLPQTTLQWALDQINDIIIQHGQELEDGDLLYLGSVASGIGNSLEKQETRRIFQLKGIPSDG